MSYDSESDSGSASSDMPYDESTNAISRALGSFINSESSTFACGGSIPIEIGENAAAGEGSTKLKALPITVRWDSTQSSDGIAKLQFPPNNAKTTHESLQKLLRDCQPATFGYKGEDILDDSYRKATKMDRSAFSADFCPYELGIVDVIAQLLLPNIKNKSGLNGVKAELYKLNIYATSGFFNAHVDTPRSTQQFGSLVVSLPCFHKGGQLVVRHESHSQVFDWSTPSESLAKSTIEWAAFYSDCEHEVREVTDGHRVTLTYNLYHTPGLGRLAGKSITMDTKSLPLFQQVEAALAKHDFMPEGGILGVFCGHKYAHTNEDSAKYLPGILKGADMAVYSVFEALGLPVKVRAILDTSDSYVETSGLDKGAWVGQLGGQRASEIGGGEEGDEEIMESWGNKAKVTWVNEPKHRSADMVHLTYGNEAGINTLYSWAAMLIHVPSAEARGVNEPKYEPSEHDE